MPDPKKPLTPKQLKTAPVVMTPRQRALDRDARSTGYGLAEYRDGESYELLKEAKGAVGHVESGKLTNLKEGLFPWPGKSAMKEETPRYQKTMEDAYWKGKEKSLRRDGNPSGYDASMRGTPATPVSTADAMKADQAKKKPLTAKQVSTAPMFEKKK